MTDRNDDTDARVDYLHLAAWSGLLSRGGIGFAMARKEFLDHSILLLLYGAGVRAFLRARIQSTSYHILFVRREGCESHVPLEDLILKT
jgi:hypothetical protein